MENISLENKKVSFRQWNTKNVYKIRVISHDVSKGEIDGELLDGNENPSYLEGVKIVMHTDVRHITEVLG